MADVKNIAFIFKAASEERGQENDPYSYELEKHGVLTKIIYVLDFKFKNYDILMMKLLHPEMYSGIIFTSPRCVRAVRNVLDRADSAGLDPRWQTLLTFAVGETTARLVRDNLQLSPQGSSAGNGVTLAPIIVSCKPSKPLLLPCGNLKMDTLENILSEHGVVTEAVEVYDTTPHPELETTLESALAQHRPTYMVYFSPSGVHNTYPLLKKSGIDMDKTKWVSIGPTTAAALQSYDLRVYQSAAKPTPQSLAEALLSSQD